MKTSTLKPRQIKCTCPRGKFSTNCPASNHRKQAWDIDRVFATNSARNRSFARGLYLILAGLFLIVAGNTVRQLVVSEPSVPAIVQQEAEHKTVTAPVRDPNLLPTLDEAFSTPIVVEGK